MWRRRQRQRQALIYRLCGLRPVPPLGSCAWIPYRERGAEKLHTHWRCGPAQRAALQTACLSACALRLCILLTTQRTNDASSALQAHYDCSSAGTSLRNHKASSPSGGSTVTAHATQQGRHCYYCTILALLLCLCSSDIRLPQAAAQNAPGSPSHALLSFSSPDTADTCKMACNRLTVLRGHLQSAEKGRVEEDGEHALAQQHASSAEAVR